MADKFIEIVHPNLPNSNSKVSEGSFELVWKDKGWVRAEDYKPKKAPKKKAKSVPKSTQPVIESTSDSSDLIP